MSLPATHKALVVVEPGKVAVKEQPLPKYGDDELLVNVKAVALNPTDWKHIDYLLKPGQSIGCDFAGDIAAVGSNAKSRGFSVGDPVAGFVRGGFVVSDNGAFQEYVVVFPENIWHKPASLPYEDAAPMGGIALSTAVHAIHIALNFPCESTNSEPILIWSGATGVGMYAIKMASLAGLKVITTASKKNWDLVKSLGADAVFDYKDPQVVQKIQQWVQSSGHGPLRAALDTISEHGSTNPCVEVVGQGGRVITLLPPPEDFDSKGADVTTILVYITLKPKNVEDHRKMAEWYKKIPSYIEGEIVQKIQQWVQSSGHGPLRAALDTISEHGSTNLCVEVIGQGGRVITRLPPPKDFDSKGADVTTILVYTTLKPENVEDHRKMAEWYKKIPSYIESGKLSKGVVPLKVFHGFKQLPEAIDYVRQGKVSAQKLVVTLK